MNVLSLFDGISCGQLALSKLNAHIENYFASEIKPAALHLTNLHFPNTIQLGDVRNIKGENLPKIDLLIGGSPCQDFSIANLKKEGLKGIKSSLFYEYLRLLEETKPTFFLLENVKMKKEDQKEISDLLGVEPIYINSDLVSAQSRPRLYWTNIPNVTPPKDKGIILNDILENGYSPLNKSRCLTVMDSKPLVTPVKMYHRTVVTGLTTLIFKSEQHYHECVDYYNNHFKGMKAKDITYEGNVFDGVRYPTKSEREKLQTIPIGYCDTLTENEAANVIGDGWTVDVIAHILSFIPNLKKNGLP